MVKLLTLSIVLLFLILTFAYPEFQENYSSEGKVNQPLTVSLVIPAIPGVNVPVIEEKALNAPSSTITTVEENKNINTEIQEQSQPITTTKEDKKQETSLSEGKIPPVFTKTLYIR